MGEGRDALTLIRELVDLWNRNERVAFDAHMAPDAIWREMSTGEEFRGPEEIHRFAWGLKDAFPDGHFRIVNAFGEGNHCAIEVEFEGTHQGHLVGSLGEIPVTGREVKVPLAQIVEARDGLITSINHWEPDLIILGQLGILSVDQLVPAGGT